MMLSLVLLPLVSLLSSCGLLSEPRVADVPVDQDKQVENTNFINTFFPSPPQKVTIPSGKAVVRDCYGRNHDDESRMMRKQSSRSSSGRGGSGPGSSSPSPASAPAKTVSAPTEASGLADLSQPKPSGTTSFDAAMAPPPPVAEPSTASMSGEASSIGSKGAEKTDRNELAGAFREQADPRSPQLQKSSEKSKDEGKMASSAEDLSNGDRALDLMATRPADQQRAPEADWGGTVYLSNDDSMSLASAQRMLYALQRDVRIQPSQVRPHELLNYFSFDTESVRDDRMFSVLASAEQLDPDTLTLSLAVKGASPPRLPLDLTLVIDRSGSMSAEGRMEYVKRALHLLDSNLKDGDRVDLVLFDNEVCTPLEDFVVGRDSRNLFSKSIDDMAPRSSTDLDAGLREAYRLAVKHASTEYARKENRNHRVMVLTDALLNTGKIDVNLVSEIGKAYDDHGVRLTGVGVGREFNDTMLDKLTEKGKGAYVYLGSEAVVDRIFGLGFESLTRTIAHDVRFALNLPPSLAMERFYGEESSKNIEDVQPINYYSGTSQLFLQDLKIRPGWLKSEDPITLSISYVDATTGKTGEQSFQSTLGALTQSDKHNLRKARALMAWTDVLIARALGSDPCGAPLSEFRSRIAGLGDDAELVFIDGLVSRKCGNAPAIATRETPTGVPFKVRVDSDIPIAEVAVQCQNRQSAESLVSGQNVASFTVLPGPCILTLKGATDMQTRVTVPTTGSTMRCLIRGGRLNCS